MRDALIAARTAPFPPGDVARELQDVASAFPERFHRSEQLDSEYRVPLVEPILSSSEVESIARAALAVARGIEGALAVFGGRVEGARILELGCGAGYLSLALGMLGAAHVVGIDLDVDSYVGPTEARAVREQLRAGAENVELRTGNAMELAFESQSFDVVVSANAVEHIEDLSAAYRETVRVLRPSGLAYHQVDPWFSPHGGHALGTLDFPWGHVRLTEDEFVRYIEEYRPFEASDAIQRYTSAFQRPRLTLRQSAQCAHTAGLDIRRWENLPLPFSNVHRRLLSGEVLRDCQRVFPTVTARDLLTTSYSVVLSRPPRANST